LDPLVAQPGKGAGRHRENRRPRAAGAAMKRFVAVLMLPIVFLIIVILFLHATFTGKTLDLG
jgi:hypothetical protein